MYHQHICFFSHSSLGSIPRTNFIKSKARIDFIPVASDPAEPLPFPGCACQPRGQDQHRAFPFSRAPAFPGSLPGGRQPFLLPLSVLRCPPLVWSPRPPASQAWDVCTVPSLGGDEPAVPRAPPQPLPCPPHPGACPHPSTPRLHSTPPGPAQGGPTTLTDRLFPGPPVTLTAEVRDIFQAPFIWSL